MWTTGSRAWERELVAECEAFFSGQYAQYLDNENRPIPVWAWLNVLAHGSEDDITALAAGEPPRRTFPETAVWHQALAFLAQELMSQAARRGRPVADLQCSTLVACSSMAWKTGSSSPGDERLRPWSPPCLSRAC